MTGMRSINLRRRQDSDADVAAKKMEGFHISNRLLGKHQEIILVKTT
jgi:hypothetical protein